MFARSLVFAAVSLSLYDFFVSLDSPQVSRCILEVTDRPRVPQAPSHLVLWVHPAPEKVGTRYKEWEATLSGLLGQGWVLSDRQYCPTVVAVVVEGDLSTRDSA